jgi:uncharacterized protein (DUF697 family)/GTP-binding protein EngB required for normal cell division
MDDIRELVRAEGDDAWRQSEGELARALSERVTVAFVGTASAGKDAAIRALFGIDFGQISPIPGSTDRVRVAPLDAAGQVLIVNAPGFGDIRREVDARAREALEHLDVVVYVLNAEGGATIDEKRDLDAVRAKGRPVLVCINKIDLIRPHQREAFVAATLAQLQVDRADVAEVAFDPLPALSDEPIGVDRVYTWIMEQLAVNGKELLLAKQMRNKALACEPIIMAAARRAGLAGAIPIPGADLAVVTAIQVKLIRDIATVFGVPLDKEVAMFIIGELLSGSMRGFVRWGAEALKAAGWLPGGQLVEGAILAVSAAVAGGTTYGVGKAAVAWLQSGRKIDPDTLRTVFDAAAWQYKDRRPGGGTSPR